MSRNYLEEINMICNFLREHSLIAKGAFKTLTDDDGITPAWPLDLKHLSLPLQEYAKKIWWIACIDMDEGVHIGVVNNNLIVRYWDDDCRIEPLCYGLQNLPLVLKKEAYMYGDQWFVDQYIEEQEPFVSQFISWCNENNIKTDENSVLFMDCNKNPFMLPDDLNYTTYSFEKCCIQYETFAPIPIIETVELPVPFPVLEWDAPDFLRCTAEEIFMLMDKYPAATYYHLAHDKKMSREFYSLYDRHISNFFRDGCETIIKQEDLHRKV